MFARKTFVAARSGGWSRGRKCSKLVFFLPGIRNQPHLWMSRQARSVSRLPRESGLHQLPYSIGSIQIPVKGHSRFLHLAVAFPCEFHRQVVEIDFILRCALQVFSCASRATLRESSRFSIGQIPLRVWRIAPAGRKANCTTFRWDQRYLLAADLQLGATPQIQIIGQRIPRFAST